MVIKSVKKYTVKSAYFYGNNALKCAKIYAHYTDLDCML